MAWLEAYMYCASLGGDLVSIHNAFQNTAVATIAQQTFQTCLYWIGLSDVDNSGTYEWTDGSPLDYTNWGPSQPPAVKEGTTVYMSLDDRNRWFASSDIAETNCFVCEWFADTPTTAPPATTKTTTTAIPTTTTQKPTTTTQKPTTTTTSARPTTRTTTSAPTTTTTQKPTTTTTAHADLSCLADVILIIDSSSAVGTSETYVKQIDFIKDNLVPLWYVNPQATEAALVLYSDHTLEIGYRLSYPNNAQLEISLDDAIEIFMKATPSINSALNQVNNTIMEHRINAQTVALLFTFSSDYDDVARSVGQALALSKMGVNLFIVGLGKSINIDILKALSGSVYTPSSLDSYTASVLSNYLCTTPLPASPLPNL